MKQERAEELLGPEVVHAHDRSMGEDVGPVEVDEGARRGSPRRRRRR